MSWPRAVLIVAAVSLVSAGLLGLVSRTPTRIRHAEPGPGATDPALGAHFTDEQVARDAHYQGPNYLYFALVLIVQVVLLVALMRGPFGRLAATVGRLPGGVVVHAALLGGFIALAAAVATLPLSFVRGYVIERAWGQSTQDVAGWATDQVRGVVVGLVIAAIAAVGFFAVVRWQPRTWWLWGWALFSLLTALLIYLYPVVIAPIFNKFTPLPDQHLSSEIKELARRAGVRLDEVLVADASRRTTAENAYVAGLWGTKRMVLYDTLLQSGDDKETLFVVAHELGHDIENHVLKGVLLSSVGLFAGFAILALLAGRTGLWDWAGAGGVGDVRAIPVLLLYAVVAGLVVLPVQNALSRSFEARADQWAIDLTHDPGTAVRVFRRLAFSNLADLRPPEIAVVLLYSHPPVDDRIRSVVAEAGAAP